MTILAMPNAHPCLASVSGTASQRRGGRLSRLGVALGCPGVELPWSASSWASNTGALRFHLSREANAGSIRLKLQTIYNYYYPTKLPSPVGYQSY